MNRRFFLSGTAVTLCVPAVLHAEQFINYAPGTIDAALAQGKTVLIDYSASWCSTCKRQERVMNALRAADPVYDEKLTFIKVDWDTYKDHEVTVFRNIPRRSTLILLRGDAELGRVVAQTSESQIKALLDAGL
ncbi:thioredoxin family protein [Sulfitobacter sp. S190]|uniref:thioredoxin family protein n=1 Tax=Sulfitobacter sp. S190 TaxID=2867022 RepID=UPI0021A9677E|nr:thioredoxin family protein [Sulfitobacter sp. S190]UWR23313.1 thioredoxin family protein [Sulfitobacter sp. S190]